jgi:hypothetical protein
MNKTVFKISILVCFAILTSQCQTKKMPPVDLRKVTVTIDECGFFYDGKRLELGKPLSDWEKLLGKASRKSDMGYVWDDLSLAVGDWNNKLGVVDEFYIFFTNLDSEEGKKGKLFDAINWRPFVEEEYRKPNPDFPDLHFSEKEIQELKQEKDVKNFIYPYTTYKGYVSLQDTPVKAGMSLQDINAYRTEKGLDIMTFRDNNINLVDESASTVGDNGEYFEISRYACNGKAYNFIIRYTNYKPEYIHVVMQDASELELYYGKDLKKRLD